MYPIIKIPISAIKPISGLTTTKAYLNRMKKLDGKWNTYDCLLAIEKSNNENSYILVGGYDKYNYLLSIGAEEAVCLLDKPSQNTVELYYKVLRRLFDKGDSIKANRKTLIDKILELSTSVNDIVNNTGFTKSDIINNYIYNDDIPKIYCNSPHSSEKTLNWIQGLSINQNTKNFLFERACRPKGDIERLTHENIAIINKFLKKESRFYTLTFEQQICILKQAIYCKGTALIEILQSMVDDYYNIRKIK